jgi:putative ABC transport system permease protein
MSLIFRLSWRNLFYDPLRFIATVVGIVFSIVLVTVQMGLFLSFERMVTTMIDHSPADLWIVPRDTKCFEDPSLLDERERFRALSVSGVMEATPVVVGFAQWRLPSGGTTPVFIVSADTGRGGLRPWNLVEGDVADLAVPGAVAIDQSYLERLGTSGLGASAEIRDRKVKVTAVTKGIRAFTTTPYVFTSLDQARADVGTPPNKVTYFLVRLAPNAEVENVRSALRTALSDSEVLSPGEFRRRSRSFWLFGTGAGAALFAGAMLGIIVGTIIVAQTLYSSTKDHLTEFATLRAIGASGRYIHKVIICQALVSAAIGFCIAAGIGLVIVDATAESALPILMTPVMTVGLFLLTVAMCILSAIFAIVQVIRLDPAVVFAR